jgi:hypothetical protein
VAETLLDWRMEAFAPLPLFVVRAETEAAATALPTLSRRVARSKTFASRAQPHPPPLRPWVARRGSRPSVSTSRWRTCRSDAQPIVTGCWPAWMPQARALAAEGFDRPVCSSCASRAACQRSMPRRPCPGRPVGACVEPWRSPADPLRALLHVRPAMRYDRPTDDARRQMAEMTAAAIAGAKEDLALPRPSSGGVGTGQGPDRDPRHAQAESHDLVLDDADPLGGGRLPGLPPQTAMKPGAAIIGRS